MSLRAYLLTAAMLLCSCGRSEDPKNSEDESAIRAASNQYIEAFNHQDVDALTSLWTDDAIFINFTRRETIQGKDELKNYFKEEFQKDGKSTLKLTINSINFQSPGKAIEKGTSSTSYETEPAEESVFQAEYVKQDQSWLLQKVTKIEVIAPLSHFEQLKDLNWLAGTWNNEGDGTTVTKSTYRWDNNKNFLIQSFNSTILGQKELTGEQVIGWDPIGKTICSWIFDSDGGFGKSIWTKQDDSWYASTTFTLFDGRRASATHVYTKVNNDTYTFSSVNRDIDGKILPNIGPFKAIRQE